ncbi:MAG: MFS transporter [Bacteroidia bacterium]|nr:MFS transporter [Bacteroidia bacterium]
MDLKKARIAVALFFFINGFVFATWTARLPAIESFYGISHTLLGSILLTSAIGSIIAMPLAGWLNNVYGSRIVTFIAGLCNAASIIGIAIYPSMLIVYPVYFLFGASGGAMDVSMNGQAVLVERSWGRSIMSSFHAVFSIGMFLGAVSGAICTKLEISLSSNLMVVSGFGILCLIWANQYLIEDKETVRSVAQGGDGFTWPTRAILPIGLIAFCAMTGEGSMSDWSALYMKEIVGSTETMAAIAFGTFGAAMTIGRLFGDRFTDMIGPSRLMVYDCILAIIGLGLALLFATPVITFIGFFIVGLGLSTIVPIVYSAAGNTPGVNPGVGIAMATTVGYAGFFVGPPVIGFLADSFGLRVALLFTLALFLTMIILVLKRSSSYSR